MAIVGVATLPRLTPAIQGASFTRTSRQLIDKRPTYVPLPMREPGFEPGPLAGQDPKSCASASFATLANDRSTIACVGTGGPSSDLGGPRDEPLARPR